MKKALISLVLLVCFSSGCISGYGNNESTDQTQKQAITVLAAASLTESFTEIGKKFEQENPEIQVIFNFAGSQTLFQQLEQGIPADVFASANQKYMSDAIVSGFVDAPKSKIFAKNAFNRDLSKIQSRKYSTIARFVQSWFENCDCSRASTGRKIYA